MTEPTGATFLGLGADSWSLIVTAAATIVVAAATVVLAVFAWASVKAERGRKAARDRQLTATGRAYGSMVRRSLLATVEKIDEALQAFANQKASAPGTRASNQFARELMSRTSAALGTVEENLLKAVEAEFERRGGRGELDGLIGAFQVGADLINETGAEKQGAEKRQRSLSEARRRLERCIQLLGTELGLRKPVTGSVDITLPGLQLHGEGTVEPPSPPLERQDQPPA